MPHVAKRPARAKNSTTSISRRRSSSPRPAARPASPAPAAPSRRKRKAPPTATPLPPALFEALRALARRVGAHRVGNGRPGTPEAARGIAILTVLQVLYQLIRMLESWGSPTGEALRQEASRFGGLHRHFAATGDAVRPPPQEAPPPRPAPPSPPPAPPVRAKVLPLDHHVRALGITKWPDVRDLSKATIAELLPMLFPGELDPVYGVLQAIERDATTLEIALAHGEPNPDDVGMQLHTIACRAMVCAELYSRIVGGLQDDMSILRSAMSAIPSEHLRYRRPMNAVDSGASASRAAPSRGIPAADEKGGRS
ncbi:hypothetical protein WMF18_28990 [Sorangium sp. So ce315]|uniref:hypothetical protein n=1 Tax=Sorangium sp. So ce315 TaxID=3133299 RepID=UPI003F646942